LLVSSYALSHSHLQYNVVVSRDQEEVNRNPNSDLKCSYHPYTLYGKKKTSGACYAAGIVTASLEEKAPEGYSK